MNRQEVYKELVTTRKKCELCTKSGLVNPASFAGLDSDQIGPWSCWQGNLNAEIIVVGQDWGGVKYFQDNKGDDQDSNNPTNVNLRRLLLENFRIDIRKQNPEEKGLIFLTNMILCLKEGNLQAPIKQEWLSNCSKNFFCQLVEIIQPKIILALGKRVSETILDLYKIPYSKSAPLSKLLNESPIKLTDSTYLFPVYHCGAGGVNRNRTMEKQLEDWGKAAQWFKASYNAVESKISKNAGLCHVTDK